MAFVRFEMANIVSRAVVILKGGLRCVEGLGHLPAELIPLTQVRPGQIWIAEKQGKMPREAVEVNAGKVIVSCF